MQAYNKKIALRLFKKSLKVLEKLQKDFFRNGQRVFLKSIKRFFFVYKEVFGGLCILRFRTAQQSSNSQSSKVEP